MMDASTAPKPAVEDETRLEALFEQHYGAVHAYARRRISEGEADDVAAETFLVAWRRIDDVPSNALPWLLGVARKVLATRLRSASRRSSLIAKMNTAEQISSEGGDEPLHSAAIAAFGRLPEAQQEALTLVAWEGLTPREAAQVVGESPARFRMRLHRARRRMLRELKESSDISERTSPLPVGHEGIAK
jgi:RNA polymerase sigma-70 factor, ECF subfamily